MGRPVANQRMFVAAYPPEDVRVALLESVRGIALPPHRLTPVEQVHLTLVFVGDVATKELEAVRESVRRSAAGLEGFELRPERAIALPEHGPARLVAVETDAPPTLLEVQRRLRKRLVRNARERAAEGFLPHLTLVRFAAPAVGFTLGLPVAVPAFTIREIVLVRSVLAPDGARHTPVERVSLG